MAHIGFTGTKKGMTRPQQHAVRDNSAEVRRSGTWATVRYARAAGRRIVFAWRDGQITEE